MSGMKIVVASNKRQSGISLDEGKKAMIFDVYQTLCDVPHQEEGEDFIFAHPFLTMEWNLMTGSDNCVNIHINPHSVEVGLLDFLFWNIERQ